ncbi:MAG: DNA recombination protein RmuC [Nitrospirota bacterium]|nr:DNA recombination protein RmuC [Nitrospirota bacterium]
MELNISFLVSGLLIGSILASLIVYIIMSKRTAFLEGRSKSSEAVITELRLQLERTKEELTNTQSDLKNESEIRAAREAQYHEAENKLLTMEKNLQVIEKDLLDKFGAISLDALSKNSAEFLKLADEKLKSQTVEGAKELEGKKNLIDRSLGEMDKALAEVRKKIEDVSRGNTEVTTLIKRHEDVTMKLRDTTEHLKQALASSKKRGEWGERMAEDIINLVGMAEGVNYSKQKTLEASSGRPDFTFFMPNRLKINMDVKFPLENYMNYLNAHSDHDRKRFRDELLKNTRVMIKQVTTRDYINPADNTVDYVILFVPNEQVYSFINESDMTIMDEALKQKVILCSPFTLYAVLAVIRQAIDNFKLEQTASEMLKLMGDFYKQWEAYRDKFRSMGDKLDAAKKEYDLLVTTRSNMLERPLKKIDDLRKQKAITFSSEITIDEQKHLDH